MRLNQTNTLPIYNYLCNFAQKYAYSKIEMKVIRTVAELKQQVGAKRDAGCSIGLVPTMGALHAGHISLIGRDQTMI